MRIGIDIRSIQEGFRAHAYRGIGRYVAMLIRGLLEQDKDNHYLLLLERGKGRPLLSPPGQDNYSWLQLPRCPVTLSSPWQRVLQQHVVLPMFLARQRLDFFHFCCHLDAPSYPLRRTVVTVMDIIPQRLSPLYSQGRSWPAFRLGRLLEIRAIKNASAIIAISQKTKEDLVEHLRIDPDKIKVIHPGVSGLFRPVRELETIAAVRHKYGIEGRYLFYLGGIDRRKNINRLIEAYAFLIREPDWSDYLLVFVGDMEGDKEFPRLLSLIHSFGLEGRVRLLGYVPDEDLPGLYSGAELFVYPSIYEGFGLPVVEAMACGVPVVCSEAPGILEAAGSAALFFDPQSTASLIKAIRMVQGSEEIKRSLIAKGFLQAARFSWDKTVQQNLEVYLTLVQ